MDITEHITGTCATVATTEDWLDARRSCIGGSEVAAILGLSPWAGPWDVYGRKVHGVEQERTAEAVERMAEGHRWEPRVLEEYLLERPSVELQQADGILMVAHAREPWATASPDALGYDCEIEAPGGVEAKAYFGGNPDDWHDERTIVRAFPLESGAWPIPVHVACQVLWYLEATGLPWWDLAVLLSRPRRCPECRVYRIFADPSAQAQLLDRVGEWRERHILGQVAPPIDGSEACLQDLRRRYPGDGSKDMREATTAEISQAGHYADLGRQIKDMEARRALAKAELLAAIGNGYGLLIPGSPKPGKALAIRASGRTSISAGAVEKEAPDIFTVLQERGLVTTSGGSTSIRTYNL